MDLGLRRPTPQGEEKILKARGTLDLSDAQLAAIEELLATAEPIITHPERAL